MKRVALLPLVAILAASAAVAPRPAPPVEHHPAVADSPEALKQSMRKLWTDHVVWTRDYIVASVGNQPDQKSAANRLMKNQEDIGGAVGVYYGKEAGDKLTGLLKEHISIAVTLIDAAKASNADAQKAADKKWHDNAEDIADFLAKANPNWTEASLKSMMKMHLSTTTAEVVARLNKAWDDDVRAVDAVYEHILKMSDVLSDGIAKQFPDKVAMK